MFEIKEPKPVMCYINKIDEIFPHPNADRLEIAKVKGWEVIIQKDVFKVGELIIYFEIDSILPEEIEKRIFGDDAKIKLSKSRVKTAKIRQVYSQGLLCPVSLFSDKIKNPKDGMDLTDILGIQKYEEKIPENSKLNVAKQPKKYENPNFHKVRKPSNIKSFNNYVMGKEVSITEKVHGTSVIFAWVKRPSRSIKDKISVLIFGEYEFCYRSMSVQLQKRKTLMKGFLDKITFKKDTGFYEKEIGTDVYSECLRKYRMKDIIGKGYEITGEIYGSGVQKNYAYGCKQEERKFLAYGVRKDGENIPFKQAKEYIESIGLEYVPVLFEGILTENVLKECTNGKSILDNKTIREGCVVELENANSGSRGILKSISESYLLKNENGTDFH